MSETIRDGRGRGYEVEVNKNHQMLVDAVTQVEEAAIADAFGLTFTITTNVVTLNSTNQHLLLYMKNTSSKRKLYNATLEIGYNGGSTNHNRCMNLQILWVFPCILPYHLYKQNIVIFFLQLPLLLPFLH